MCAVRVWETLESTCCRPIYPRSQSGQARRRDAAADLRRCSQRDSCGTPAGGHNVTHTADHQALGKQCSHRFRPQWRLDKGGRSPIADRHARWRVCHAKWTCRARPGAACIALVCLRGNALRGKTQLLPHNSPARRKSDLPGPPKSCHRGLRASTRSRCGLRVAEHHTRLPPRAPASKDTAENLGIFTYIVLFKHWG